MGKYYVQAAPENCSGCLKCELACSDAYQKAFNPWAACIKVTMYGKDCTIEFTDDCNQCGICADNCFFECLTKTEKEAQA